MSPRITTDLDRQLVEAWKDHNHFKVYYITEHLRNIKCEHPNCDETWAWLIEGARYCEKHRPLTLLDAPHDRGAAERGG